MIEAPPKDRRPKTFPAPEFPPRRSPRFARLPPAVFPPILGLLGLVVALRLAGANLGLVAISALADAAAGVVLALWLFAIVGLKLKNLRRWGVVIEDLRPLPGRAGYAAATLGGMAAGAVLLPFAPTTALVLILAALVSHVIVIAIAIRTLIAMPPEAREVNPVWHMFLVGHNVAVPSLVLLGQGGWAPVLFWIGIPMAATIWTISIIQLVRRIPPAPLRPLMAIHLAPASLLSTAAAALGHPVLSLGFLAISCAIFAALILSSRWILQAGFSPMWGALTFPAASFAVALLTAGSWFATAGLVLTAGFLVAIPVIAWRIFRLWPGGQLAAKTNAAEA